MRRKDAYVDEASPTTNFGASNALFTGPQGGAGSNMDLITYLNFDLQARIPEGSSVTSVELQVRSLFGLRSNVYVHEASSSFAEAGITWNDRPAYSSTVLASKTSGSSGWWLFSSPGLTSGVQAWVNDYASGKGTLVLRSDFDQGTANNFNSFYSRESGFGTPTLVVNYAPPPTNPGGSLVSDVHLDGRGNSVTVSPGTSVSVQFEYQTWNPDSTPSASKQIVVGLDSAAKYCAYDGIPGVSPGVSGTSNIGVMAPSTAGTYHLYWKENYQANCADALSGYGPVNQVGTIIVQSGGGTIGITRVLSHFQNFFVRGIDLENEFVAIVDSGVPISRVVFWTSGGQTANDDSGGDGWSATFKMGETFIGETLYVRAEATNGLSASAELPLNVVDPPAWMQNLLSLATTSLSQRTAQEYDNVWELRASLRIPDDVFALAVDVPTTVPLFAGAYEFDWFFLMGFSITSEGVAILEGGGGLDAHLFGRPTDVEFALQGSWRFDGESFVWDRLVIRGSGEFPIPLFTRYLDITVQDGFTVVKGVVEFSVIPSVELTFTFEPGTDGLVVVSGVSLAEISGELGIAVRGEGNLTLLGHTVGAVEAELGASVVLEASEDWLREFSLYGRVSFTVLDSRFDLELSWSTQEPSTRGGGADPTWHITSLAGRRPEFASAGADFLEIRLEGLTADVARNATLNPKAEAGPPVLPLGAVIGGSAVIATVFLVLRRRRHRGGKDSQDVASRED